MNLDICNRAIVKTSATFRAKVDQSITQTRRKHLYRGHGPSSSPINARQGSGLIYITGVCPVLPRRDGKGGASRCDRALEIFKVVSCFVVVFEHDGGIALTG